MKYIIKTEKFKDPAGFYDFLTLTELENINISRKIPEIKYDYEEREDNFIYIETYFEYNEDEELTLFLLKYGHLL